MAPGRAGTTTSTNSTRVTFMSAFFPPSLKRSFKRKVSTKCEHYYKRTRVVGQNRVVGQVTLVGDHCLTCGPRPPQPRMANKADSLGFRVDLLSQVAYLLGEFLLTPTLSNMIAPRHPVSGSKATCT